MPRETATLAILFADIAKSTHLYEKLGNAAAQQLIGACISRMADVTLKHKGVVIKTIGDEIMSTFPTAADAVAAGKEMHLTVEQMTLADQPGFAPPNIYVGIQIGPVVKEKGDVFGDAVNVAARMMALAKQRQILTTEETVKSLSADLRQSARCIDRTTIRGKSGEVGIYEIIWEQHDVTVMLDTSLEEMAIRSRLELSFAGSTIDVDIDRPSVTMGRQPHNDIVVNDNRVSRTHARIEYRRGKFVLIDQSTNGTFVLIQGKKSLPVKHDETPLIGSGFIGLGREATPDSAVALHFSIKI